MNTKRHLTGCVLVVLLLATFPLNASASDGMDMPTAHIEFNQAQGAHMEDIIHLNGQVPREDVVGHRHDGREVRARNYGRWRGS